MLLIMLMLHFPHLNIWNKYKLLLFEESNYVFEHYATILHIH